jgi:hypothetical protein
MAGTLDLRPQRWLATAALLDGEAEALEEWRKIPRQERCAICLALIPDWLSRVEKQRDIINDWLAIRTLVQSSPGPGPDNVAGALQMQMLASHGSAEAANRLNQLPKLLGEDDEPPD